MDGPRRFDGHPLGHLIGWSHLHAQSRISTFQHSMPHDRSGPDGLPTQAITDSAKSVYRCLRGTPTVRYTLHTKAQKWSAARLHCLPASCPLYVYSFLFMAVLSCCCSCAHCLAIGSHLCTSPASLTAAQIQSIKMFTRVWTAAEDSYRYS